jgi:hypothetical protein
VLQETKMKLSILAVMAAVGACGALAGCEDYYYPYGPYAGVDYAAYYDGYYGDYYGGYWGPGDYFYYYDRGGGRYRRDDQRHFRREAAQGYRAIQGHAPPAGRGPPPEGRGGPGQRDRDRRQ